MQKLYGKVLNSTVNCKPDTAIPNNYFQFCGIESLAKLLQTLATVAEVALQNRRKLPNVLVEKWQKLTKRYDNSNKLKKIVAKMQTIVFLESYMFSIDQLVSISEWRVQKGIDIQYYLVDVN
jgi:hypothetical protein